MYFVINLIEKKINNLFNCEIFWSIAAQVCFSIYSLYKIFRKRYMKENKNKSGYWRFVFLIFQWVTFWLCFSFVYLQFCYCLLYFTLNCSRFIFIYSLRSFYIILQISYEFLIAIIEIIYNLRVLFFCLDWNLSIFLSLNRVYNLQFFRYL